MPKYLSEEELAEDPLVQFDRWYRAAVETGVEEPGALFLATADRTPSGRVVLLKGYDERGFVFYTNYGSRKASELAANPFATAVFWWKEQSRQLVIEGKVEKVSREESAAYFSTRSRNSQLGAWASKQDEVIASREALDESFAHYLEKFEGQEVPLPSFWGGYRLQPQRYEFWQGQPHRLHDRFEYVILEGIWEIHRLNP